MTAKKNRWLGILGFSALAAACSQGDTDDKRDNDPAPSMHATAVAGAKAMASARGGSGDARAEVSVGAAGSRASSLTQSAAGACGSASGENGACPSASTTAGSQTAGVAGSVGIAGAASMRTGAAGSAPGGATVATAGAAGATSAPSAGAGAAKPANWRIAFLGDSITETTCTSILVSDALHKAGHTSFDLVGTKQNQQACGVDDPDRDVEGHSGYLVTEIVGSGPKASELPMWCAADKADLVLMHFGTNDAWNTGVPLESIVTAFSDVIANLRAVQPSVTVLVAQIIPLEPENCPDCPGRVRTLNEMIPTWAASESTLESPIYVVDQWTGFDAGADTNDRIHPNLQGAQKMAAKWVEALQTHNVF